jgi:hypothetical protein
MSCKICKRAGCTESFHSIAEQEATSSEEADLKAENSQLRIALRRIDRALVGISQAVHDDDTAQIGEAIVWARSVVTSVLQHAVSKSPEDHESTLDAHCEIVRDLEGDGVAEEFRKRATEEFRKRAPK